MSGQENKHTEEHKAHNKKVVKIGNEKKLLLFDNEAQENSEQISEMELQEVIKQLVVETFDDIIDNKKPLYEAWIEEADYPSGFDIQTFKSLPSFKKRTTYTKEYLGRLGGGSSRVVFASDSDTVVKVATNKKGQAQNEVEVDVSRMGYNCVAKVKDYDEDGYHYIEAERARKMKKSDWQRLTGWVFEDWADTIIIFNAENSGQKPTIRYPETYKQIKETELFNDVMSMMIDFDMPAGDISKLSSWGIVNRGEDVPVLIDYGLTQSVWDEYYNFNKRR